MQWQMAVLQGRPIYIQHLGQVNIKKIYDITTEERMLKFHVQEYERCIQYIMPACSKVAGRHIEQTFAILDVKGAMAVLIQTPGICSILAVVLTTQHLPGSSCWDPLPFHRWCRTYRTRPTCPTRDNSSHTSDSVMMYQQCVKRP